MAEKNQIWGTGRRKTSVARVKLTPGSGKIIINKRAFEVYFPLESQRVAAKQPLALTGNADKFDMLVLVSGGGPISQSIAVRLGCARALLKIDANLRPALKTEGFLTRDARMKERKKYGQPGARKRFQFSKR